MKALLAALVALLVIPAIAAAAPQQLTLMFFSGTSWGLAGSAPPILDYEGQPAENKPTAIVVQSKKVSDALRSLDPVNGQKFICPGSAFLSGNDASGALFVTLKSINTKKCFRSVVNH